MNRLSGLRARRLSRAALVVVSALGLLFVGSPQIALAEDEPDYGSISGRVTAGGEPVQAHVCLDSWDCTYSDSADGSYSFDTVDRSSTYRVSAEMSGFLRTYYASAGGVLTAAAATPVDLSTSADATDIDIALIKGATVSGTVSVSSGPVDDAKVCVKGTSDWCTYTDSEGHYQLQVSPGTRVLKASKEYDDDATITGLSASLTLADEQVVGDVDIALVEGTGLSGTVTGPIVDAGAEVRAYQLIDGAEHFVDSAWPSSSGSYFLRDLPAGSYHVRYRSDAYLDACYGGSTCATVTVVSGKLTALDPVQLVAKHPGSLAGIVVGEGTTPVPGATVTVSGNEQSFSTTTDAHGAYRFDALASGIEWQLKATKDGYTTAWGDARPRPDATVSVANLRIMALGSITVKLTGDGGVPLEGLTVKIAEVEDYSPHTGTTDAAGSYTFTGVAPGHYLVSAEDGDGYLGAYYPGVASEDDATPIALPAGGSRSATLALHKPSSISGTVTGTAGSLLTGWAYLYDEAQSWERDSVSITNGSYTFQGLTAGHYTVRFDVDGYRPAWLGGSATRTGASWFDVDSAQTSSGHDIQLTRIPSGTVTVTIPDSPVDLSELTARLVSQSGAVYDAKVNGADAFVLTPEQGTYSVEIDGSYGMICGPDAVVTCSSQPITVVDGGTASLAVTLPQLGSVSGAATLPDSTEGWVDLIDAHGQRVAETYLDESGPYLIRQVPLGDYTIALNQWDDTSDEPVYSGTIHVDGDVTKDLVAVASTHSISGKVALTTSETGEDGWARIFAVDKATNKVAASDWLDSLSAGQHSYKLPGLADGSYLIGLQASYSREVWYQDAATADAATAVAVTAANVGGINLTLPAKSNLATLTVRLTAPNGVDLADGVPDFSLYDDQDHLYYSERQDDGYVFVVPKGHYRIVVDRSSEFNFEGITQTVDLTADTTVDVQLARGARLSGRLVDSAGVGVVGEVSIPLGDDDSAETETDAWGYWSIGGLPAGSADVQAYAYEMPLAEASASYTMSAEQTLDVGNLVLGQGGRLRVLVPEMDDDAPSVQVRVTDLDGKLLDAQRAWPNSEDPEAAFSGLPAGKVLVHFDGQGIVPGWWQGAATAAEATPVTIAAWTTTTIRPEFTRASVANGTLSGTLSNATSKSGTYSVLLFDQYDDYTYVDVAADGSYSASVPPGSYRVRAALCVGYWMGESDCMGSRVLSWYGGSSKATATEVEVKSSATTSGINVAIGAAAVFTSTPAPTIDGQPIVGSQLTASAGTWAPAPDSLAYQWKRDGAVIADATAATYTLTAADQGHTVTVTVTGSRAGLTTVSRTSLATATVQKGTITAGTVSINGTPALGAVLNAGAGGWTPSGLSLSYQWSRDGVPITGATAASYQVQVADVGARLTVTVTGSRDGYTSATKASAQTDVIASAALSAPATVSISGTPKIGSRLDAQAGQWGPAPVTIGYQWLRNGAAIAGATSSSYTVIGADGGSVLAVRVTGSKPGYTSVERTSAPTAKVPGVASTAATPKISGKAQVGQTLTATVSGWKPASASFSYQWYRNGSAISGANSSKLVLTAAEKGKKITVKVTGSAVGYNPASATSKATATIAAGSITPASVTISGQARFGQVLTAATGAWKPDGVSLKYQWLRSGKTISKATGTSYTLTAADLGKKISVKVTATKTGYNAASKTSKATAKVSPAAFVVGSPTVSGTAVVGQLLTVVPGTWSPQPAFSYQWLRNGKPISKAKGATYKLVAADLGKKITVKLTATKAGYATVVKTTSALLVG